MAAGPPPQPPFCVAEERSGHCAVVDGGCLYVWGGYVSIEENEVFLPNDELWIYEIDSGLWSMHLMEGDLPPSMSGSCGSCLNGNLYLFGGFDDKGYSNQLYYVNLRSRNGTYLWKKITDFKGHPPTPRDKLACWVYMDRLIYFGGYGCRKQNELSDCFDVHDAFWEGQIFWGWHNDVHVFDTITRTWYQPTIKQGVPPQPRAAHSCAVLGNKGYVFGGRVLVCIVSLLPKWGSGSMPEDRGVQTFCKEGQICQDENVWGPTIQPHWAHRMDFGQVSITCKEAGRILQQWSRGQQTRMNDLHSLNLDTWVWSGKICTNGEKPRDRSWHTLTPVTDDRLFLFGGLSSDNVPLSDGWIYVVTTNRWEQLAYLPRNRPRLWHTACLGKEGEVMVFGGSKDDLHFMDTGHCSDLLIFQTQPYSLLRLTLDCIGKNSVLLRDQISWLPSRLQENVLAKITFWSAINHRQEKKAKAEEQEKIRVS